MQEQEITKAIQKVKANSVTIAKFLCDYNQHIAFNKNDDLYIYDEKIGIYVEVDGLMFDRILLRFFKKHEITDIWKTNRINEIRRALYADESLPQVEFDNYHNLICLKNGVLNLDTKVFTEHKPEFHFTTKANVMYEPDQTSCQTFVKFLRDIFMDKDQKPDPYVIDAILQISGYMLYPVCMMEKIFLFLGGGGNGKSVYLDILALFFSEENITYYDLHDLSQNSLERDDLITSRINFSSETKAQAVDSEQLKKISSCEGIVVKRKHKKQVKLKPRTKIIVAANGEVYFNDKSMGIDRRLYFMDFPNSFVEEAKYNTIKDPEKKGIYKIQNKSELFGAMEKEKSAILNMFIGGLNKLRANNWQLPETENFKKAKAEQKASTDTLGTFLLDNYELSDNDKEGIQVEKVLAHYREWYKGNVSERALNLSITNIGNRIKDLFLAETFRRSVFENQKYHKKRFYTIIPKIHEPDIQHNEATGGEAPISLDQAMSEIEKTATPVVDQPLPL